MVRFLLYNGNSNQILVRAAIRPKVSNRKGSSKDMRPAGP